MRVSERMQADPITIDADAELGTALQLMLWSGIRHLPVVKHGILVGLLSHRDVLYHRGSESFHVAGHVRDAMTARVETIGPDDPLEDAAAKMATERIGCLPVVERGRVVGILTTTDLVTLLARCEIQPGVPTVAEIMTPDPSATTPDEPLGDAARRMFNCGIRHLPVIEDGRVVGMLSDRDVRSAVGRPFGHIPKDTLVDDAMSHSPKTLPRDAPITVLVDLLIDDRVGAVPIVDAEGRLEGIASYIDVLRATSERTWPAFAAEAPRVRMQ